MKRPAVVHVTRADPSVLLASAAPQPLQTSGSPAPPGPTAPSFSSLLQTAYAGQDQGQGPGGLPLLDEGVQAQLRAALLRLPMHQALRAAKHLLLYVRSAVENFAQVSTACCPGPLYRRPSECGFCRSIGSELMVVWGVSQGLLLPCLLCTWGGWRPVRRAPGGP